MPSALYLHIPFCVSRCRYCDFATAPARHGDALMGAYADALIRLIGEARDLELANGLATAYLGGGTPTMLGAEGLARLISAVGPTGELSFEANPESLTDEVIFAARTAGATRASIGVQSFDDVELRALGRIHGVALARERVTAAVRSGLSVSLDLMCGIPYQTRESWERSLSTAIDLGVSHVSCYPLVIEEGTAMERLCEAGKLPWPEDDVEADYMETAARMLGNAGFSRYEVASYAKDGCACRHNIAYWTGVEYLGLGTAAASMLGRASYEALREAVPGLPAPAKDAARFRLTVTSSAAEVAAAQCLADLSFEAERLTEREVMAEDLMLGLRMTEGIPTTLIERARAVIPPAALDAAVNTALTSGLARWTEDASHLAPTPQGWLMGNQLYGLFWDLA